MHDSPRVDDLLAKMTLEEKAAQVGCGFDAGRAPVIPEHGAGGIAWPETTDHHPPRASAAVRNRVQRDVMAASPLGIPTLINEEALCGLKVPFASVLPDAVSQAATWDPHLIEEMGRAIGRQMDVLGVQQALAPLGDVARDPRWGRVEETYGEDPYLAGCMAAAFVRGMQAPIDGRGRVASLKHFIAYSASDGGRNLHPTHVGPRLLREVHGLPFEMAIRLGGALGVMSSYNSIDCVPVQGSHEILTELLRGEYGFEGIVISDLGAVEQLQTHHGVVDSHAAAIVLALEAGLDLELAATPATGAVVEAVRDGRLEEAVLDQAVRRVLSVKERIGLLDQPLVDEQAVPDVLETEADRVLARRVAERSMVLLRNEPAAEGRPLLPIAASVRTLAVLGPNADRTLGLLGNYSCPVLDSAVERMVEIMDPTRSSQLPPAGERTFGDMFSKKGTYADDIGQTVDTVEVVSILDGLRARAGDAISIVHERGCGIQDPDTSGIAAAAEAAREADLALVIVGDQSGIGSAATVGEGVDSAGCELPGVQRQLVEAVVATGTPTVVVLAHGRPFVLGWMVAQVPAILSAGFPGEEGGHAVAAALFGDVNPGGHTVMSYLPHAGVAPMPYNRVDDGGTYHDTGVKTVFPFGHGLSYTTFEYTDLEVGPDRPTTDGEVHVACTVTNTGAVAGDEVVQLYTRDPVARTARPRRELKGFRRLTLQPGEARRITFTMPADRMALYDPRDGWVVEPGDIQLLIGASSEDIRLRGSVRLAGDVHRAGVGRALITSVDVA